MLSLRFQACLCVVFLTAVILQEAVSATDEHTTLETLHYYIPEDFGLHYISLQGPVKDRNKSKVKKGASESASSQNVSILLHIFIRLGMKNEPTGLMPGASQIVRGFFFAEDLSHPNNRLSKWGVLQQPLDLIQSWRYPVTLKDPQYGVTAAIKMDTRPWKSRHSKAILPIPFKATFSSLSNPCLIITVHGWSSAASVCLRHPENHSVIDRVFLKEKFQQAVRSDDDSSTAQLQNYTAATTTASAWMGPAASLYSSDPSFWILVPPFRNIPLTQAYISTLVHSTIYHVHVGFSGIVVYAGMRLIKEMSKDRDASQLMRDHKLVLVLWENKLNDNLERGLAGGNQQSYSDTLDHRLVYNHAILAFQNYERVTILISDADEFFILKSPYKSIQQVLQQPRCMLMPFKPRKRSAGGGPRSAGGGPRSMRSSSYSWITMHMRRYDYQSSLPWRRRGHSSSSIGISGGAGAEAEDVWQSTNYSLECSPLQTYTTLWGARKSGKLLLSPEGTHRERISYFNIHNAVLADDVHDGGGGNHDRSDNKDSDNEVEESSDEVDANEEEENGPWLGRTEQYMKETCSFLLHVVNMWDRRTDLQSSQVLDAIIGHSEGEGGVMMMKGIYRPKVRKITWGHIFPRGHYTSNDQFLGSCVRNQTAE